MRAAVTVFRTAGMSIAGLRIGQVSVYIGPAVMDPNDGSVHYWSVWSFLVDEFEVTGKVGLGNLGLKMTENMMEFSKARVSFVSPVVEGTSVTLIDEALFRFQISVLLELRKIRETRDPQAVPLRS